MGSARLDEAAYGAFGIERTETTCRAHCNLPRRYFYLQLHFDEHDAGVKQARDAPLNFCQPSSFTMISCMEGVMFELLLVVSMAASAYGLSAWLDHPH